MKKLSQVVRPETSVPPQTERFVKAEPVLVLTGHRRNGRVMAKVYGVEVWLTPALFSGLGELVVAIVRTPTGIVERPSYEMCRLRSAIDRATRRRGLGAVLIQQESGTAYRVALARSEIVLDARFRELKPGEYVSADVQAEIIRTWLG